MHNFVVEHRKGSLNCVPDALSRMFQNDEEEEVPAVGAVSWATTTKDEWYLDWQKKVLNEPNRFPGWKVLGGPFTRSKSGYEYILVFQDLFTRWPECIPVRRANAKTIRKELKERIILRYGAPEVFLSDNGTEFKNQVIDKYLNEIGAHHSYTPPYHPQANPVLWHSSKTSVVPGTRNYPNLSSR